MNRTLVTAISKLRRRWRNSRQSNDQPDDEDEFVIIDLPTATPPPQQQLQDIPPEVTAQPQNVILPVSEPATFSVAATGSSLGFMWEKTKECQRLAGEDSAIKRSCEGEAAYESLQNSFDNLCKEIDPDAVVSSLFSKKLIGEQAVEKARNKYVDRHSRVQSLLLDIMKAVQRKPKLRHDLWRIFEVACVPSLSIIKDDFERLLKKAEGWKPITSSNERFDGASTPSLTIKRVRVSDQGMYRCIVSNDSGTTTSETAALTLYEPISIVTHPQDQFVAPGREVTLTIETTGTTVRTQISSSSIQL